MSQLKFDRRAFIKTGIGGLAISTLAGSGAVVSLLVTKDLFTLSTYVRKQGSVFQATDASGNVSFLTLEEVVEHRLSTRGECFSLIFRGSATRPLSQNVYKVAMDDENGLDLLLVRVWSDSDAPLYEGVINRAVGNV